MYPEWTPDVPPRMTGRDVEPPDGRWLVAYRDGRPAGCAGTEADRRKRGRDQADLCRHQRLAAAGWPGRCSSRLEEIAREVGYRVIRLDTGAKQQASVALFRSSGYEPIADYNGNPVAAYWFEKRLA